MQSQALGQWHDLGITGEEDKGKAKGVKEGVKADCHAEAAFLFVNMREEDAYHDERAKGSEIAVNDGKDHPADELRERDEGLAFKEAIDATPEEDLLDIGREEDCGKGEESDQDRASATAEKFDDFLRRGGIDNTDGPQTGEDHIPEDAREPDEGQVAEEKGQGLAQRLQPGVELVFKGSGKLIWVIIAQAEDDEERGKL